MARAHRVALSGRSLEIQDRPCARTYGTGRERSYNPTMRFLTAAFVNGCLLILGSIAPVWAQGTVEAASHSGWYVGGSIGASWASELDQEGWNREATCYPTDACFNTEPTPPISGYRWRYTVGASVGARYEIAVGRVIDRFRLELSLAQRKNGLDQMFRGITYYDGTPIGARSGGSVVSNPQASIDHLRVRTLALQAYYDFPVSTGPIVPYLGIGVGPAFATVSGLRFSTRYEDTSANAPAYDPPLSFYNSRQEEDISDTVPAAHLHAGADYRLNDRTLLGLRLSYSMLGAIEASGTYASHPWHAEDPELRNHNRFTGVRDWTLALTFKRRFGN